MSVDPSLNISVGVQILKITELSLSVLKNDVLMGNMMLGDFDVMLSGPLPADTLISDYI
jgi:hypothetical protein